MLEYLLDITLVMYGNFMWKLPDLREKYMYTHLMEFDVSRNGYLLTKTQIWAKTCNVHEKVPRMVHNLTSISKLDSAVEPLCLYVALVPGTTTDGTVTAKYCRHHGKFTRGKSAHFTPNCKLPDHKKFAFVPRAAGNMALVSPAVLTSPSPAPNREPSGPANHLMIPCGPRTYFDFSNMPALECPESNFATVDEASEGDS